MNGNIASGRLDPNKTALVVHMVKGVADEVDIPFIRPFRRWAEKTEIKLNLITGLVPLALAFGAGPAFAQYSDTTQSRQANSVNARPSALSSGPNNRSFV